MKIIDIFEARYYRDNDKFVCPDCRGRGWQVHYISNGPDDYDREYDPCETCDETGIITRKQAARFHDDVRKDLIPITEASYAFPGAKETTFSKLELMVRNNADGLVFMGAGGDIKDWIDGVSNHLKDEGIASSSTPSDLWAGAYTLTTSGGRIDLVLEFKKNANVIDMGKLAVWRVRMGDASWLSDYVHNYRHQFDDQGTHYGSNDDISYDPQPGDDEPLNR